MLPPIPSTWLPAGWRELRARTRLSYRCIDRLPPRVTKPNEPWEELIFLRSRLTAEQGVDATARRPRDRNYKSLRAPKDQHIGGWLALAPCLEEAGSRGDSRYSSLARKRRATYTESDTSAADSAFLGGLHDITLRSHNCVSFGCMSRSSPVGGCSSYLPETNLWKGFSSGIARRESRVLLATCIIISSYAQHQLLAANSAASPRPHAGIRRADLRLSDPNRTPPNMSIGSGAPYSARMVLRSLAGCREGGSGFELGVA